MAIKGIENYKGIDLTECYNKIVKVTVQINKFRDAEARAENLMLDTIEVQLPINSVIYDELKNLDQFADYEDC